MLAAVLTCDFLISPALVDADSVSDRIDDLVALSALLQNGGHTVLIEDDAMEQLMLSNRYPTEPLFEQQLKRSGVSAYSPRDVTKTVNRLLSQATEISRAEPELLVETVFNGSDPVFERITDDRRQALQGVLTNVAIRSAFSRLQASILHSCKVNRFETISIDALINYMIPAHDKTFPFQFTAPVSIHHSYAEFLDSADGESLYNAAQTEHDIKIAIFVAARRRRYAAGIDVSAFSAEYFSLGASFVTSLRRNQCQGGHKFGSAAFDAAADIVSGCSGRDENPFWSNENAGEAREYNGYKAYRTHISKKNEGMRLMFWKSGSGHIVLANVGPKSELQIDRP